MTQNDLNAQLSTLKANFIGAVKSLILQAASEIESPAIKDGVVILDETFGIVKTEIAPHLGVIQQAGTAVNDINSLLNIAVKLQIFPGFASKVLAVEGEVEDVVKTAEATWRTAEDAEGLGGAAEPAGAPVGEVVSPAAPQTPSADLGKS